LVEFVVSALKRTKRISQPGFSDKLQRSLAHPRNDVDLLRAIRHYGLEPSLKLPEGYSIKHGPADMRLGQYLSNDSIKNGDHVSHMVDVEDRVQ
jgi:hypothetical protein